MPPGNNVKVVDITEVIQRLERLEGRIRLDDEADSYRAAFANGREEGKAIGIGWGILAGVVITVCIVAYYGGQDK